MSEGTDTTAIVPVPALPDLEDAVRLAADRARLFAATAQLRALRVLIEIAERLEPADVARRAANDLLSFRLTGPEPPPRRKKAQAPPRHMHDSDERVRALLERLDAIAGQPGAAT